MRPCPTIIFAIYPRKLLKMIRPDRALRGIQKFCRENRADDASRPDCASRLAGSVNLNSVTNSRVAI